MKHIMQYGFACLVTLLLMAAPVRATVGDVATVGVTATSSVGAGLIGTPVVGLAVFGVTGTTEIGSAIARGLLGWGDPPDFENFQTRANPPLLIPSFNTDATASRELNAISLRFIETMSRVVRSARGIQQSLDRLGGAKLVGSPRDVHNQMTWLAEFQDELAQHLISAAEDLDQYLKLIEIEFPVFYDITASAGVIRRYRDMEARGEFGPVERRVIRDWMFDESEMQILMQYFSQIPDDLIEEVGATTLGLSLYLVEEMLLTDADTLGAVKK